MVITSSPFAPGAWERCVEADWRIGNGKTLAQTSPGVQKALKGPLRRSEGLSDLDPHRGS